MMPRKYLPFKKQTEEIFPIEQTKAIRCCIRRSCREIRDCISQYRQPYFCNNMLHNKKVSHFIAERAYHRKITLETAAPTQDRQPRDFDISTRLAVVENKAIDMEYTVVGQVYITKLLHL